jgi:hypothetical protein
MAFLLLIGAVLGVVHATSHDPNQNELWQMQYEEDVVKPYGAKSRRQLAEDLALERHNGRPGFKGAAKQFTTTKYTHLMASNCHPEPSGFFGSTSGKPAVLEYGFELETSLYATADRILDVITEHVMDEVLTRAFPGICYSSARRLQSLASDIPQLSSRKGKITGFKFQSTPTEAFSKSSTVSSVYVKCEK